MKVKKVLTLLIFSCVVYCSCNNKVKILAPYKDITVVYGLLDQSDSIHYVRINKAFAGIGNAYSMAQVYDSIYYPAGYIKAVLRDSNPNNGTIVKIDSLDTTTTVTLSPGVFTYPKQLLYYTKVKLNPNDYYNLLITNIKTGKKISGSTALLPDALLEQESTLALSFNNQLPTVFSWTTTPNARIYQMTIRFYYDEVNSANVRTGKYLDWVFVPLTAPSITGGAGMQYSCTGQGLCSLILNSISDEEGVTRYVDSAGIMFTSGSDDFNTYIQLSQPPLGINQDVPSFSDLENGVGLFTCRHTQTNYERVGNNVIDTLVRGATYAGLNFQF